MPQSLPHCHACGARRMHVFHEQRGLPLNGTLLPTRGEALSFPTGDLRLAFCGRCGFIQNLLYDPQNLERSPTEGTSSAGRPELEVLAGMLIDRYSVRGKSLLDIGCGSGEFLELLSELGGNYGVGIDPAAPATPRSDLPLHYIRDVFDERYVELEGDLICCRNTLDRVAAVGDFVGLVRRTMGVDREPVAFFEVADVRSSLADLAFWAFSYEQPSCFSAGSLARLFRLKDFDVFDLRRDPRGESLLIDAVASSGDREPCWEIEDDMDDLRDLVVYFQDHSLSRVAEWRRLLQRVQRNGGRTVLWGSDSHAVSFLTALESEGMVAYAVDASPARFGRFLPGSGLEVVPPEFLREYGPAVVIATDAKQLGEIDSELARLGLEPALTAL